jgi:hypothetical protein
MSDRLNQNYIIEYISINNLVKVSAVCPNTRLEASVICPIGLSREDMNKLAIRKLDFLKRKTCQNSN